jgi:hypothetical protein
MAIGTFFIVFPAIVMLILFFVRFRRPQFPPPVPQPPAVFGSDGPQEQAVAPAPVAPPMQFSATTQFAPPAAASGTSLPVMAASGLLGLIGWLLLLASIGVGLCVAFDIPGMIAAGLPDPGIAQQLNREFGDNQWLKLFRMVLNIACGSSLFIATVLLMAARRWCGVGHMFRAIIGAAAAGGALTMLSHALADHWIAVANSAGKVTMAASIASFLDRVNERGVFFAALFMIFALAMLFWPASRKSDTRAQVEGVRS